MKGKWDKTYENKIILSIDLKITTIRKQILHQIQLYLKSNQNKCSRNICLISVQH